MDPHHCHQSSTESDQRAHGNYHQSQFPAAHESNHEAKNEGGEPLDEDGHLICDSRVYLVDITAER